MSRQKRAIYSIIRNSSEHMTAEQIYMKSKKILPSISVGTVYRNLGNMANAGEIRRITIPNSPDRFDKSVHVHEHLVCQCCGELFDVHISDLKAYFEKQIGAEILSYNLSLNFICEKCKKKEEKNE